MKLLDILKLAKQINKFAEINTNGGVLICDGSLEIDKEVFVETEDAGVIPAPDGTYESETQVITVVDGKVATIEDKEQPEQAPEVEIEETPLEEQPANEEQPADEQPADDEKDKKIAELEQRIAELEKENEELKEKLGQAEEALSKPVKKTDAKLETQNSGLKTYFRKQQN